MIKNKELKSIIIVHGFYIDYEYNKIFTFWTELLRGS